MNYQKSHTVYKCIYETRLIRPIGYTAGVTNSYRDAPHNKIIYCELGFKNVYYFLLRGFMIKEKGNSVGKEI